MFDQPYLTRSNGVSQGQRFPFIFPVPGSPANKTLNYAQFLPITGSPGYDIHNRMPYAEHFNFSIQIHRHDACLRGNGRSQADFTIRRQSG
jgi:hypothetical protein